MATFAIAVLLGLTIGSPATGLAPLHASNSPSAINGEYLVVFKEEAGNEEVQQHMSTLRGMAENGTASLRVMWEWQIGSKKSIFRGYAASMDKRLVSKIRGMAEVKYVERNQVVTASQMQCEVQYDAPWNLVRVTTGSEWDPSNPPTEYRYKKTDGEGVTAYIIDTGIDDTHPLFDGRADRGVDLVDDDPPPNGDPNGHGTHIAGVVNADVYGLARSARTFGVRVLNAGGSGSIATVIAGIAYVAAEKNAGDGKKVIGNMSLGGALSTVLNDAVNACVEKGVHMTVSAGGDNSDACSRSPGSAERAFTATASDIFDQLSSSGNYGPCIDIIAPGVNIISTIPNGGTASFSGTSMSAAHVAGVIAKVLSDTDEYDDDPDGMKAYLKSIATKDKITGVPPDTDNDLLFYPCM